MAKITLGIGTSHGPMLSTPPNCWGLRVEADRRETAHAFRGETYSYERLLEMRADEPIDRHLEPAVQEECFRRCELAIDTLAERLAGAAPDVALIIGNDQRELFDSGMTPALWLFTGAEVFDEPVSRERIEKLPPGISVSAAAIKPKQREIYPTAAGLAHHLARSLTAAGFDPSLSDTLVSRREGGSSGMPHAFGFVYQRVMRGNVLPHVPIMLNTFYPPNQPNAGRCMQLGRALYQAVQDWPDDVEVALIASGGLSHLVIDEPFDREFIQAMQTGDSAWLSRIEEARLQSGTSEVKNWLPVVSACAAAGLKMDLIDYVPCYRSAAGTGSGMGFAAWQ